MAPNIIALPLLLLPLATAKNASSPWCKNPAAPAVPGMYGDLGAQLGLVGPNRSGVFVDVPLDVAALFNQGLIQFYGFNMPEACRNFETAAAMNASCVLCHWGVAVCNGPGLNFPITADAQKKVNQAAQTAHALAQKQSLTEKSKRMVAGAMSLVTDKPDTPPYPSREAYVKVMCLPMPSGEFFRDPDIDSMCAGAIMSTSPWNYYEGIPSGGTYPMKARMKDALTLLLQAVDRGVNGGPHPLAIHYLIHLVEPTNAPPNYRYYALNSTKTLYGPIAGSELVPAQGHLTHMPAHLFLRVGMYHEAVLTSMVAAQNNARYVDNCLAPYVFFHNVHMLIAGALLGGERGTALKYSSLMKTYGLSEPKEANIHSSFGDWDELLNMSVPGPDADARQNASTHYGKALAHYAKGDAKGGDAEAALCRAASKLVPAFECDGIDKIFDLELQAVRAWRIGKDAKGAAEAYEKQIAELDAWRYFEPPGEFQTWYYSVRRCQGTLYLADTPIRNASKALEIFEHDLEKFVNNTWSLVGASQSYKMLGQKAEADKMEAWAKEAWKWSDVPLPASACLQLTA